VGIYVMDIDDQIELEHLLFKQRKCRTCKKTKDLIYDFYLIRKNKKGFPSSYSYECKECTIKRIIGNRNKKINFVLWEYPDW
jgi:hypothetical protein